MLYSSPAKSSVSELSINEMAELAILGVLFDDTRNIYSVISVIGEMDTATWQPTADVLEARVEALLAKKEIAQLETAHGLFFSVTGEGIKRFFSLMKQPLPVLDKLKKPTLALKSHFLEQLPPAMRTQVADELTGYYTCELQCLEQKCSTCPNKTLRSEVQNNYQLSFIKGELNWLDKVTQDLSCHYA